MQHKTQSLRSGIVDVQNDDKLQEKIDQITAPPIESIRPIIQPSLPLKAKIENDQNACLPANGAQSMPRRVRSTGEAGNNDVL